MSLLSSIPAWGWCDIGFNIVVLVALAGETDVVSKWVFPENILDLLPPEAKRKKFRKVCEWFLIVGIIGEIGCLLFSLYGTATAEKDAKQASQTSSSNEVQIATLNVTIESLRSNNLALEAKINPRRMTLLQRQAFIDVLNEPANVCKTHVRVIVGQDDLETENFATQIREMLNASGYGAKDEKINYIPGVGVRFSAGGYAAKDVPIVALCAGDGTIVTTNNNTGKTVMMMTGNASIGITNVMFAYWNGDNMIMLRFPGVMMPVESAFKANPSVDPNAILYGICDVFKYIGFECERLSGTNILKPGEIAFYVPPRVY